VAGTREAVCFQTRAGPQAGIRAGRQAGRVAQHCGSSSNCGSSSSEAAARQQRGSRPASPAPSPPCLSSPLGQDVAVTEELALACGVGSPKGASRGAHVGVTGGREPPVRSRSRAHAQGLRGQAGPACALGGAQAPDRAGSGAQSGGARMGHARPNKASRGQEPAQPAGRCGTAERQRSHGGAHPTGVSTTPTDPDRPSRPRTIVFGEAEEVGVRASGSLRERTPCSLHLSGRPVASGSGAWLAGGLGLGVRSVCNPQAE
jgi:hypothetical protein